MIKPLRHLLLSAGALLSSSLFAQNIGDAYPKDRDLIYQGNVLHDSEDYDLAIAKYLAVNPNDSFYSAALQEMSTTYMAAKQPLKAVESAYKGLLLNDDNRREFLLLFANALDDAGFRDSALAIYKQGLEQFPYYNRFQYEQGIAHARHKEWRAALNAYTASLQNNPFHAGTHFRIAFLAAECNEPALSLMAFSMYMIMNNTANNLLYVVDRMEKVAGNEYTNEFQIGENLFEKAQLSEVNEIILSKAALNGKYKSKVKLNFWIVKQLQVMLEKLPSNYDSGDPLLNFYVRFFEQTWKKNLFEGYLLYCFQNIPSKEIEKEAKAKQAKINEFTTWAKTYFNDMRSDRIVTLNGKQVRTKLWYDGLSLAAMGDEDDKGQNQGYWQYYTKGFKSAEGVFIDNKKSGKWTYYYFDGKIKSIEYFDPAGIINGPFEMFHPNGFRREVSTYKNEKFDGLTQLFNVNGTPVATFTYNNGQKNGIRKNYDAYGRLQNEGELVNDIYNGTYKTFYTNGAVDLTGIVKEGDFDGPITYYHLNGKIRTSGAFAAGKRVGSWKWYDNEGTLQTEGNYATGNQIGVWKYYHPNGVLREESNFSNDKLNGLSKSYDSKGRIWDETIYKNGKPDSYKNYDTTGTIIAQAKSSGGKIQVVNFTPYRAKKSEGLLVNGIEEGEWKYYHPNGTLAYTLNFEKGQRKGVLVYYYKNGVKSYELNYKDNQRHGYYRSYYLNGKLQAEGYYQNDEQHGEWKFYTPNGALDAVEFFQEGALTGKTLDYMADSTLHGYSDYSNGFFNNFVQYDSSGKVAFETKLNHGTGLYQLFGPTGKIVLNCNYIGGKKDGEYVVYHSGNKVKIKQQYLKGIAQGAYTTYHENGKVHISGRYINDERDSVWNYYDENGNRYRTTTYKFDEGNGKELLYYANGNIESERILVNDEREGEYRYYGYNGELVLKMIYENGVIVAYAPNDANGKPMPYQQVKNETFNLVTYYANGKKALSFQMVKGYYEGQYIQYYPNGNVYEETPFVHGNYEGTHMQYNENGTLKFKHDYVYNDLNGWSYKYDANGKLLAATPYLMDLKHGIEKQYDATGKLIKTRTFYYGDLYE